MIPLTRRTLLLPCLAIGVLVTVRTASAATREPPLRAKAPAAPDTAHFLPRWLHSNGSAGYGWIQGPALIRQRYEAGQDFELGLEARPRSEEHTSELQSPYVISYAVFCLKKK